MNIQDETSLLTLDSEQERRVAERVKEAREYLGLSQEFVAERLGISRPSFSALETGKRKVSGVELHRLARLLKQPMSFFFDDDEILRGDRRSETVQALFRTTRALSEQDQQQLLRFAEFLKQAGRAPAVPAERPEPREAGG